MKPTKTAGGVAVHNMTGQGSLDRLVRFLFGGRFTRNWRVFAPNANEPEKGPSAIPRTVNRAIAPLGTPTFQDLVPASFVVVLILAAVPLGTGFAQTCMPSPTGLISWWRAEGTVSDQAGGNNGNLAGNATYAPGEVGLGFSLDGNGDGVVLGTAVNLQLQSFTIEGWIKRASTTVISQGSANGTIFGFGNQGYGFGMWSDGKLFLTKWDVSNITTSSGISDLNFHHVAVTKSGAAVTFYIDGTLAGTFNYNPTFSFTTVAAIGARSDGLSTCFYGRIDELAIYGRALSSLEIQSVYATGSVGKCTAPTLPAILEQPQSQVAHVGGTTSFNVLAAGDPLQYQWRFNSSNLVGATGPSLVLYPVQTNQAGGYSVLINNSVGTVTSLVAVLQVDPSCISAPPGLVAWWPGEGDVKDHAAQNDGSAHGGLSFAPAESGQGLSFNGFSAYAALPASEALDLGSGDGLAVEFWINPIEVGSPQILFEWNDSAGNIGVHLDHSNPGIGGAGSVLVDLVDNAGGSHLLSSAANVITPGVFQHVALTFSKADGVAKIYRNGSVVASQSLGTIRPRTGFPLYLGARVSGPSSGQYFGGLMDEVAVYNRRLADTEVAAIFNAGALGKSCAPPQVLIQPEDQLETPGHDATFTVTARGTAPLSYQWRYNGLDIERGTNSSLVVSNVQPSVEGDYSVKITNFLGSIVSSNAHLKVQVVLVFGNGLPLTNSTASFGGPVTIELQNAYSNGVIFYTLDGSTPSFLSAQYTAPFVVTQAVILRALGYSADFFESGQLDPITILIPPSYTLTTSTPGGGNLSLEPAGGTYLSNTIVRVTATPTSGWSFLQWLGDATGTNPSIAVTVNRKKLVQAIFGTTLNTTTAGGGSVNRNPAGGVYPYGTVVWLSAIPSAGNVFGLWGNAASGNVNPLSFGITNPNPTVSSLFGPVSGGQAALTVVPLGGGRVSVNPRSNSYTLNTSVSISATPDSGRSFLGWSGDTGGTQNPLALSMNANRTIFANFTHGASLSAKAEYEGLRPEGFVLTVSGDFGGKYEIDGSTNLTGWTSLTILSNTYGAIQFLDPAATNLPWRFYRAVLVP